MSNHHYPVLRDFRRSYELRSISSYLDEIHKWAQKVKVPRVDWKCEAVDGTTRGGYRAVPIFPAYYRQPLPECTGLGRTQDEARRDAESLLRRANSDMSGSQIRWIFTPERGGHQALPIKYTTDILNLPEVVGYGSTKKAAMEESAYKLLEGNYCWVE
ncbi:hypothetical protein RhiJN_19681 [Ceratobasidium sp. AG-Ba]|nr:hypothetical protein RhiJN_04851 [Ceratobasidium sp. AG-Ba]QRV91663.1 hypothetical protein RhiJN_19681 [Ceratobasidium sp. AG-Ba]